jgi:sulfite exporter TauE/SafE
MDEYLFLVFIAGMAGSFHCAGMCGGFACLLGGHPQGGRIATLARHSLYNVGRITTYAFLGAVAGLFAGAVAGQATSAGLQVAERALALAAGALMILMALQLFGFLQRRRHPWSARRPTSIGGGGEVLVVSLRSLLTVRNRAAPLAFGVLNGFLPCPLVYGVLAHGASLCLSSPGSGPLTPVIVMVVFGLGTFPMMLLIGLLGWWLQPLWRRWGVRLAGSLVLTFGLVTLARAFIPLTGHQHLL